MPVPRPDPSFLDSQERLGYRNGQALWRSSDRQRLYVWDSLHGHIEVYNARGHHLGVADAVTGTLIGLPVRGRRIDV